MYFINPRATNEQIPRDTAKNPIGKLKWNYINQKKAGKGGTK